MFVWIIKNRDEICKIKWWFSEVFRRNDWWVINELRFWWLFKIS